MESKIKEIEFMGTWKFPQNKEMAIDWKNKILSAKNEMSKNDFLEFLVKALNLKYRGLIARGNHYPAHGNKHTIVNTHTIMAYVYNVFGHEHIQLTIKHDKHGKYYLSLVLDTNWETHHKYLKSDGLLYNQFSNNLVVVPSAVHKQLEKMERERGVTPSLDEIKVMVKHYLSQ